MKAFSRLSFSSSLVRDGYSRTDSSCVEDTSIAASRMNSYEGRHTTNVADQFGLSSSSDVETRPPGDTLRALTLPICAKTEQGKLHDILQSFTRRHSGKAERRYSLRLPPASPGAVGSPFINVVNKENSEPTLAAQGYISTGRSCSRCSRLSSTDSATSWGNSKDGDSHSLSNSSVNSLESADNIALCTTPRDANAVHYQHRNVPTRKGGFRRLRMPGRSDGTAKWTERFKSRKTSRKNRTAPASEVYGDQT